MHVNARESRRKYLLRRRPPFAEQLRLNRAAKSPRKSQLNATDASEKADELHRPWHPAPPSHRSLAAWPDRNWNHRQTRGPQPELWTCRAVLARVPRDQAFLDRALEHRGKQSPFAIVFEL